MNHARTRAYRPTPRPAARDQLARNVVLTDAGDPAAAEPRTSRGATLLPSHTTRRPTHGRTDSSDPGAALPPEGAIPRAGHRRHDHHTRPGRTRRPATRS